ncbi:MAG TPA: hypothetical protein VJ596_05545, partial [Gemmatimonadaceae bacterium]|nr:hypothetical protein [Gemmatimonadaceae bacterium]
TAFARDHLGIIADIERGVGFRRFLKWMFPGTPDSVANAMSDQVMAANDASTLVAVMRSLDALAVLPSQAKVLRAPALVAVGAGDPLLPQSRWIASWWPRAQLLAIQGADHLTVLFHPQTLAAMRALMR